MKQQQDIMRDYSKYKAVDQRDIPLENDNQYYAIYDMFKKDTDGHSYVWRVHSNEYMEIVKNSGEIDDDRFVVYRGTGNYNGS